MYETDQELRELQSLLDKSADSAGVHIKSIFRSEHRLSADQLATYLKGVRQSAVATVNSRGEPRVSPVDSVFFHGKFYLSTDQESFRVKHLRRNPHISLTQFEGADPVIIVHGVASLVYPSDANFPILDDEWIKAYGTSITSLSDSVVFICVEAETFLAYSFHPQKLTG